MPIYEYHCQDCGKNFEELVSSEAAKVKCTECGSENTTKLISCCRFKTGGTIPGLRQMIDSSDSTGSSGSSGSSCAGCTGGDCSSCG